MKEFGLDELKKEYKKLQEKYRLPDFEGLNQDFYIEKIAEFETEFLTREIRRFIADKIYNYLRFIETLLNPVNAPMFIFSVIKSMSQEDKKKFSDIYDRLSKIDLELIKLDVESSEKKDAEFIRQVYSSWQEIKKEMISLLERLNKEKSKEEGNTGSGYFG